MIEPFGDSQELADELIDLVIHGHKRATAAALAGFELEQTSPPEPGLLSIATDGRGNARLVLRTTTCRRSIIEIAVEMPTVFERFEVVYTE